jgi:TIR domain/NACHT domain
VTENKTRVRIFESYGWRDAADIAQRLKDSLDETDRYDVWIDREHLRADDKHFSLPLQRAVEDSEVVVALLSPHSVRGVAGGDDRLSICYNELRVAEELRRPIVPVRVRKFVGPPPFVIINYQRVDWLDWDRPDGYSKGLAEITRVIDYVLAGGTRLDRKTAYQPINFVPELGTAKDSFTGRQWLFDRVDKWLAGPNPCLLIEGVAGSGKTALVAGLARRNTRGRILGYHFCGDFQPTVDPADFVRSVSGMLATGIDAYAELLWNGNLETAMGSDPDTMLRKGVLAPLRDVPMDGSYCIAVDALDEADAISVPVSIPVLLSAALPAFPRWLKLLVTTRPEQRVQRLFDGAETCVLGLDNHDHVGDLRTFVASRLERPALSGVIGPAERERAATRIATSAAGNFQYADRVLDALANGEIASENLGQLPRSLGKLYYEQARRRFPNQPDYRLARKVLGVLLAAREPLSLPTLTAILTDLDADSELQPTLRAVSCFTESTANGWRIAHKSIADWLISEKAGEFTIDTALGRELLLAHCAAWARHREPYALKHVIAHLLEHGKADDAMAAVQQRLFEVRRQDLNEPRLDAEDARILTAAHIAATNVEAIVTLAKTSNVWRRDGVAAALQSPSCDNELVDRVVGELLAVSV